MNTFLLRLLNPDISIIENSFDYEAHNIMCPQCNYILIEPVKCIKCDNSFCKKCIEKLNNICPNYCCNTSFEKDKLKEDILSNLAFKCNKCKDLFPYDQLKSKNEIEELRTLPIIKNDILNIRIIKDDFYNKVKDIIICPLCKNILIDPFIYECQIIFCRNCNYKINIKSPNNCINSLYKNNKSKEDILSKLQLICDG